ncbi:MAG: hypothetical protein H7333_11630 [Bdellovibrionales bacterium]|nr:hypothetical protein [Oligoflexia bacterium]
MNKFFFFLMISFLMPLAVQAEYQPQFWVKKSEIKKQSRWSLDDWLSTKDRSRSSDLWLSFNSPSPYEFFLMGAANFTQLENASQGMTSTFGLGAYAQAVGLEFDRETLVGPAVNGRLHFRIFGSNVQNTNFTLHLGIRQRMETSVYRQAYYGASATMYLKKSFGVTAQWRSYFSATPNAHGELGGSRIQAGPFIDYGALRVLGNWISESETGSVGGYTANASGWMFGAQIFF